MTERLFILTFWEALGAAVAIFGASFASGAFCGAMLF